MELSNFDSEIPMTVALESQTIRQISSILGKRLFILFSGGIEKEHWPEMGWKRPTHYYLKVDLFEGAMDLNWHHLKVTVATLKKCLYFYSAKIVKTLWRWDVWNKLHASIDSEVEISQVDLSISLFVKRFSFVMLNKNMIHAKNAFTLLFLFLIKHEQKMMGIQKGLN